MKFLRNLLRGLLRWIGGSVIWIIAGLGALLTLVGASDLYFGDFQTSSLYFLIGGLVTVIGSAVVHNKLTGI